MNLALIIILHFIIYALPVFLSTLFSKEFQLYLNYAYLGVLFVLVQLFDTLYYIQITENLNFFGGDIAYCALIFSAMFLIISQPEPKVVRNLIYFFIIINLSISLLFLLLIFIFDSTPAVSHLANTEFLLEFTLRSLLLSLCLFSSEILLQLLILKQVVSRLKNQIIISMMIVVAYALILILDGILYPIRINLLFPGSNYLIIYSVMAKIVFGTGFGILFFIYLNLFPSKIQNFTENQISFINYLLPPKRRSLLKKYQKAQEEITQLRDILPICSKCKKIRDDEGYWNQLEPIGTISFRKPRCALFSQLLS